MWEPQPLTTLRASKACRGENFTFFTLLFFIIHLSGVRLSPLGTAATTRLLYQPQMVNAGDCGAIGGTEIGRGNQSTLRKLSLAPLCPSQIPYCLTRTRTRTAAMEARD
jgi:hypothetical protein